LPYRHITVALCAVVGCHNSYYNLERWKQKYCDTHGSKMGIGNCTCLPPFQLFPFPTERKDPEGRKIWIKYVSKKDTGTGKIWFPKEHSRICSDHFVDGKPTIEHPYPSLNVGHDITIQKKGRRTVLKHDLPVKKSKNFNRNCCQWSLRTRRESDHL